MASEVKLEQGTAITEGSNEMEFTAEESRQVFPQTNPMISRIRSNSACRNYNIGPNPSSKKRPPHAVNQKTKPSGRKYVSSKPVAELFASKKAQEEIRSYEVRALVTLLNYIICSLGLYI